MTAKQDHHTLLWVGGAAAAALGGYEFVYKPWRTSQLLAAAAGAGGGTTLSPSGFLSSPTLVGPSVNPGGVQGSITDPRISPGGDVGQAMWRKNWTQAQAATRLAAIKKGYSDSLGAIAQLKAQQVNPNAGNVAAAQLDVLNNDAAAANDQKQMALALAAGDGAGAAQWAAALALHQQQAQAGRNRIAQATAPPDNTASIQAYESTIAALKSDYGALTGMQLA